MPRARNRGVRGESAREIEISQIGKQQWPQSQLYIGRQMAEGPHQPATVGSAAGAGKPAKILLVDRGTVVPGKFFVGGDVAQRKQSEPITETRVGLAGMIDIVVDNPRGPQIQGLPDLQVVTVEIDLGTVQNWAAENDDRLAFTDRIGCENPVSVLTALSDIKLHRATLY